MMWQRKALFRHTR